MPPDQQLANYLAGALAGPACTELETELAALPEALRELVEQRRLDAALGALLDAKSERIEAAIMASVHGATHEAAEARVLEATILAQPTRKRLTLSEAATDSFANCSPAMNLGEAPFQAPGLGGWKATPPNGGSWKALCGWFHVKPRRRWAGVTVTAVLVGLWTVSFWSTNRSGQRSQPGFELAGADRESELVRELAPLVVEPPVWTGSEQQSAWLTALAAVTASGGNEP